MDGFIAIRVIQASKIGIKEAQAKYKKLLTPALYRQFKENVDLILVSENLEEAIVPLD